MSGVGRGRGWLNLKNKNTKSIVTVGEDNSNKTIANAATKPNLNSNMNPTTVDTKLFSDNSVDYSILINKIRQLNVNDDGIKFNQKIKDFIEKWSEECKTITDVENSFEVMYQTGLVDEDFATKLVLLMASRTFLTQEIHEQRILILFVRKLQCSFENAVQLQRSDINAFRNSIKILGEFCNKARSVKGKQFSFLAAPLLAFLEMLLESTVLIDLKLFAMQLYLNGSHLKNECLEKISELLSKVRLILSSDKVLSKEGKLWLLLSLEVANNRFALLPSDMHKFYQDQLGDEAMAYFQGTHGMLTVQTFQNTESLDEFQSNVNVLQVVTSPDSIKESQSPLQNNISTELSNVNGNDFQNKNHYFNKTDNQQSNKTIKAGRPILGAGARLYKSNDVREWVNHQQAAVSFAANQQQQEIDQNNSGNWFKIKPSSDLNTDTKWHGVETESNNKWDNQKKTGVGEWDKKKTINKFGGKGWEHDDRFETNYS